MNNNQEANHARPVNDWVVAVYVLSVKSFTERIAHISAALSKHGIQFRFMFDHDANELDAARVSATFGDCDLHDRQKSLVLKNIQVWQEAVGMGYKSVLIFEDDALLSSEFPIRFDEAMRAAQSLPEGWMIFLGGMDTRVPNAYFLQPGPLVELPIATAEGCVHDRVAMQKRLDWLKHNKVRLPADHLIRQIDEQMGIKQYWLRHPIVEQGSITGLFQTYLDANRQRHSQRYITLRNRWNKLRRPLQEKLVILLAKYTGYSPQMPTPKAWK